MTRPMMTGGGDQLRAMRQKAKVEPPKPAPAKPIADAKSPAKPKKSKTRADYEATLKERRELALSAAQAYHEAGDGPLSDELLRTAGKKIASFLGSRQGLERFWNADGTRKPPVVKEGYRGYYVIRIIPAEPGFCAQIWHNETALDDPKEKTRVVDYCTTSYTTPESAKQAAFEHAKSIGIQHRLIGMWKTWYEGERNFEEDRVELNLLRSTVCAGLVRLVLEARNGAPESDVNAILDGCYKPIMQYFSCYSTFSLHWDATGKWIGPKKPVPSGKKATKAPSHYLANFQKALERGDLTQADSRILHALRNDFPVDVLKQYETLAAPFRDTLSNFGPLRAKLDLIPSGQS